MDEGVDSWGEWRRHVLIEMEEHSKSLKEIVKDMGAMRTDNAALMHALRMEINADINKLNSSVGGEISAMKADFTKKISGLETELAVLKTKVMFLGTGAAIVISLVVEFLKRMVR